MLTVSEQRELRQIEEGLRDTDRGFARRLALVQGVLRLAAPGRRAYPLVLALLARLVAVAGWLLMACATGAMLMEPTTLMAIGDTAWPGWEPGQEPGHGASQVRDRQHHGTGLP